MCAMRIRKEEYPINIMMDAFPEDKEMWRLSEVQKNNLEKVISETLTNRHHKVFDLRYKDNMTLEEISAKDGVTSTSIGTILKRSIKRIGTERNRFLILNGYDSIAEFDRNKALITNIKVYERWTGQLDVEIYRDNKKYRVLYDVEKYLSYKDLKKAHKDGFVSFQKAHKECFESFKEREGTLIDCCTKLVYEANPRTEKFYEENMGVAGSRYFGKGEKVPLSRPDVEGMPIIVDEQGLPDLKQMDLDYFKNPSNVNPYLWSSNFGEWVITPECIDYMYGFADGWTERLKRDEGWNGVYRIEDKNIYVYLYD